MLGNSRFRKNSSLASNLMRRPFCSPWYGILVLPGHKLTVFLAEFPKLEETPFFKPLPAPSKRISIKIPQAIEKPVRKVRSLFFFIVLNISRQTSNIKRYYLRL